MPIAVDAWRISYGLGLDEDGALQALHDMYVERLGDAYSQLPKETRNEELLKTCALAKWADEGCPRLMAGHKFAAAAAMTQIPSQADVHVPWRSFWVEFPDGLLSLHDEPLDRFEVAAFASPSGARVSVCLLVPRGGVKRAMIITKKGETGDMASALFGDGDDESISGEHARTLLMCRRITLALLFTLQHSTHWREHRGVHKARDVGPGRMPPPHRNIWVGPPIKVDCRQAVRDYVTHGSGEHAPPSVQCLVRGHYKRQVVGIGRTGRKVIWVEPYWRGDELAPILARPYLVTGGAA